MDTAAVLKEYADLSPLQVRIATHQHFSEQANDPEAEVMAELGLPSEQSLLDVGCGTGTFLKQLATTGHRGRLIGLDTSEAAVSAAARIPGVQALRGSALKVPLETSTVDICTARHMLYHVPDPLAALHEFGRVTRPGGRVTVVVNHARNCARTMDWVRHVAARFGADTNDTGLNDVNSGSLPDLMTTAYGEVRVVRVDNALVFHEPAPLTAFAEAALTFCGVAADFPHRDEVIGAIRREAQAWFEPGGRVWRDPKGYVICSAPVI
ncbi:class I SAM-dependent methyltransferase [Kineosporia babensis]|uniref:Methyltransferase domain-containing protein n=1 Tax=Kineosporia babensis TaxID=499548 RepID=A0A9X1NDW5_9ACTN|nr:class I SAM-dependent methyltransferase [Kineosporia babensis]MCD5311268.1 methyltransferase domain-containing protein [Kineosporia babensis]